MVRTARVFLHPDLPPSAKGNLRLRLGRWLAVALEFELGADILRTAIAPSWSDIGMLAAIAAIRTGLNYFLDKEIQRAARSEVARAPAAITTSASLPSGNVIASGCGTQNDLPMTRHGPCNLRSTQYRLAADSPATAASELSQPAGAT